jgi:1,2-diacylglycerol 3-beta-glucosyltransferase
MSFYGILYVLTAVAAATALLGSGYVTVLAATGFFSKRDRVSARASRAKTRFLVLVPAHNEEPGIAPTLESLRAQNYPEELRRVIVIADNCTDRTASISREAGFECWERDELKAPGKGQALRWALDRLGSDNWDAVAFVDADTHVDAEFLTGLDSAIQQGVMAIQGRYDFDLPDHSYFSLLTFASKRAENDLFWRPRERFGCMGFIVGNGFCVKREVLQAVPWTAYSIVEDVEYAVELALHGIRIKFLESAKVVSRSTRRSADAAPQRLRWASGTFQVMLKYLPRLLQTGLRERSLRLLEMAVALTLTSRVFLVYLLFVATAGSLLLGSAGPAIYIRIGVTAGGVLLCIYVSMVLSQIPNVDGSRFRALISLPIYICWLLLVHAAAALGMRHNAWVRTAR